MIELGQKVEFKPFQDTGLVFPRMFNEEVTGIVVYIHRKHEWFAVEYGKHKQRICFQFNDIGNDVHIVDKEG